MVFNRRSSSSTYVDELLLAANLASAGCSRPTIFQLDEPPGRKDGSLHVEESGAGDPLLMLHGAGVSGWMWRPTLGHLGAGARTIVPDLPGHGRSAGPYASHAETVGALVKTIERCAPGGALVVGFSMGAQLAILLAANRPDLLRGAVIVSAETRPMPLARLTTSLVSATAPLARQTWFARLQARQLKIPDALLADYLQESAQMSRETLVNSVGENLRFTLPRTWSAFDKPVLVMVGQKERRLMHESARLTHEALPGSELRTEPGCTHGIPFQQPRAFADTLTEWLRLVSDNHA